MNFTCNKNRILCLKNRTGDGWSGGRSDERKVKKFNRFGNRRRSGRVGFVRGVTGETDRVEISGKTGVELQ